MLNHHIIFDRFTSVEDITLEDPVSDEVVNVLGGISWSVMTGVVYSGKGQVSLELLIVSSSLVVPLDLVLSPILGGIPVHSIYPFLSSDGWHVCILITGVMEHSHARVLEVLIHPLGTGGILVISEMLLGIGDTNGEVVGVVLLNVEGVLHGLISKEHDKWLGPNTPWDTQIFIILPVSSNIIAPALIVNIEIIEVEHLSVQVAVELGAIGGDELEVIKDDAGVVAGKLLHLSVGFGGDHHAVVSHRDGGWIHIVLIVSDTVADDETFEVDLVIIVALSVEGHERLG